MGEALERLLMIARRDAELDQAFRQLADSFVAQIQFPWGADGNAIADWFAPDRRAGGYREDFYTGHIQEPDRNGRRLLHEGVADAGVDSGGNATSSPRTCFPSTSSTRIFRRTVPADAQLEGRRRPQHRRPSDLMKSVVELHNRFGAACRLLPDLPQRLAQRRWAPKP